MKRIRYKKPEFCLRLRSERAKMLIDGKKNFKFARRCIRCDTARINLKFFTHDINLLALVIASLSKTQVKKVPFKLPS